MALFYECMQSCAYIVLDFADIVRDRDFSPISDNETRLSKARRLWAESRIGCVATSRGHRACDGCPARLRIGNIPESTVAVVRPNPF